ncbi:amino acid ABC transporter permease [Biostraticola tofi]|uniref:Polar amino acid transport system permease protein n=1 Tax=Biostraticola tofi TaxID=466109 RepID=A0A4R3YNR5_9GAMM|nr:amino acid ABC transporter permease [Biostraticola tofi]TCV94317.1 polar amino acid transport system permease protein [Biostraticola tofi]
MDWHPDWAGVLTGQPWQWILSGFSATLYITLVSSLLATGLTVLLLGLRLVPGRLCRGLVAVYVSIFRNTPLLVQLLFWYFAAWAGLPQSWRFYIGDVHSWAILPVNVSWLAPEFLSAAWGLGLFGAAFFIQEIQAGLNAVPAGQREAALSQGFSSWSLYRLILLPQGLTNAWQPLVGQYLNLMKLSSLASGISYAELTYQISRIESYNAHALEGYAVGTLVYLLIGVVMSMLLLAVGPERQHRARLAASGVNPTETLFPGAVAALHDQERRKDDA